MHNKHLPSLIFRKNCYKLCKYYIATDKQVLAIQNLNSLVSKAYNSVKLPPTITAQNVDSISDLEMRSLAKQVIVPINSLIDVNHRFLFLSPIGNHCYNFGQFPISLSSSKIGNS